MEAHCLNQNVFLCPELMHKYGRQGILPCCTIKIDIQKAYKTLHWDFLKEVLRGLNFPERYVLWVMECVTTSSSSVTINGALEDFFPGQGRLRQGDLSFLF